MREESNYQLNILSDGLTNWPVWKIRLKLLCYLQFLSIKLLKRTLRRIMHRICSHGGQRDRVIETQCVAKGSRSMC